LGGPPADTVMPSVHLREIVSKEVLALLNGSHYQLADVILRLRCW
jgi:hypothetical protein